MARDGYTLQRIFNLFNNEIKNFYVYAPRFFNLVYRLDYEKRNYNQSESIIDYYSSLDEEIKLSSPISKKDAKKNHEFIQQNLDKLLNLSKPIYDNYKHNLSRDIEKDDLVGIIDTITGEFSSQRLIQNSLINETHAIYWSVLNLNNSKQNFSYSSFIKNDEYPRSSDIFSKNWDFIEFLITSPEYPVKSVDENGCPQYEPNPSSYEVNRAKLYPYISDGAVDFANDIRKTFNDLDVFLDGRMLIKWINCFIDYPTAVDKEYMTGIKIAKESNHSTYIPLFIDKVSFSDLVKHPISTIRQLKNNIWTTFSQDILLLLFDPLKIQMRGVKRLVINLFPKMKRTYFILQLKFTEGCYYKFIIGKLE